ncbi:MAG: hypothetical protein EXR72_16405 [Myxococcales bacterium]|nr:hypothetical protein [Myxococcales bacterium]
MGIGFQFDETMTGTYTQGGAERPMSFTARARARSLLGHLTGGRATLEGHVEMEGFATHQPMSGEVDIAPIRGRRIRYEFAFTADDGKRYHFAGQKDVTPLRPLASMTQLPALITDEHGTEVASAKLHFDTRDLPSLLMSFRPVF